MQCIMDGLQASEILNLRPMADAEDTTDVDSSDSLQLGGDNVGTGKEHTLESVRAGVACIRAGCGGGSQALFCHISVFVLHIHGI